MHRFLGLFFLWMVWSPHALAQGVGGFLSPGPLAADHADLDSVTKCTSCHDLGRGLSWDKCMGCHDTVRDEVRSGTGFHAKKGDNCATCHPDHRGRDFELIRIVESDFDHDATGFPLRQAHAEAACADCHTEAGTWEGLSTECVSCHTDPHGAEQSSRSLLGACEDCHDAGDWHALPLPVGLFDHNDPEDADYPLEFAHSEVACQECHPESRFVPIASESCEDCHGDTHTVNFRQGCEECHERPDTWLVQRFEHIRTGFAIEGLHARLDCESCHGTRPARSPGKPLCATCHEDVHRRQFGATDCGTCHTVFHAGFAIPDFDHDQTHFPLVGEHRNIGCEPCHGDGRNAVYRGIEHDDCDSCHTDAHEGRYEPTRCERCHTPEAFERLHFDHDDTEFPHTGSHVGLECDKCHTENRWTGFAFRSCVDCHGEASPHEGKMDRDRCSDCHQTTAFADIAFDHKVGTGFDLHPQHSNQACGTCHEQMVDFRGNERACSECHDKPSPTHYDGACGDCHPASHWAPGELGGRDHAITGFALHGAHGLLPCEDCHDAGQPRGLTQGRCVTCHTEDDPHRHGLGNQCEDCHVSATWFRTRFRHTLTGFPLRGSHRLAACEDCHAQGYIGTPRQCWRCHEADADPLTPAHQSAYFPNCDSCHRPFGWDLPRYPH